MGGVVKMKSENKLRTGGYGFLPYERQQEFQEALRRCRIAFRIVGKGADQEITLLKISATGVIPAAIKAVLAAFGIEFVLG